PKFLFLKRWHFTFGEMRTTAIGIDDGEVLNPTDANAVKLVGFSPGFWSRKLRLTCLFAPLEYQWFIGRHTQLINKGFVADSKIPQSAGDYLQIVARRFEPDIAGRAGQNRDLRSLPSFAGFNRHTVLHG